MVDYMATCECDNGWDGELCQLKTCDHVDSCVAEHTEGCLFTKERGAMCRCKDGYTGHDCSTEPVLKTCAHEVCVAENTDRCTYTSDLGPTCHCKDGYTGRSCEIPIDLCSKAEYKNCNGHGTCELSDGLPTCTCEDGWMGITCEYMSCDNSEACVEHQHDSCSNVADRGAVCQCSDGFKGIDCSESTIDFGGMGK